MSITHTEALLFFTRLLPQSQPDLSLPEAISNVQSAERRKDPPQTPSLDQPLTTSPTNPEISPTKVKQDPLIYHYPVPLHRVPIYDPESFCATRLIFSLTATTRVYSLLAGSATNVNSTPMQHPEHIPSQCPATSPIQHYSPPRQRQRDILFLHRPFNLNRQLIPHGTLVLQSHTKFDEIYTTGFNEAFARQYGVGVEGAKCLKGYKGDPERRIGLVGKLGTAKGEDGRLGYSERVGLEKGIEASVANFRTMRGFVGELSSEFGGFETCEFHGDEEREVSVVASLNAFTKEIVERVTQAVRQLGSENDVESQEEDLSNEESPELNNMPHVLILTGAAKCREEGMAAAREAGIAVLAVGHRRSEMWGVRYLAEEARRTFGGRIEVVIVDEPEDEETRESEARLNRKRKNPSEKVVTDG